MSQHLVGCLFQRLLKPIEQRRSRLIGEESGVGAHRSPLFARVLFKAHILMFVPDDLFHTWLLVYNLTHSRTSTRQVLQEHDHEAKLEV